VCKWRSRVGRAVLAALALTTLGGVMSAHAADSSRAVGDIRVFATLGYPGTPGGLAVDGQTVYVDTSAANFDRLFDGSDKVYAYSVDSRRQLGQPIDVTRQYPVAPMGLAGIALDSEGRLYVADMNGRIDRVDPRTGAQEVYSVVPTGTDTAAPDMPTFVVFDNDGNLYVGDAGGDPIIWRIPPGGGTAQPWFVDPRLAGTWAGTVLGLTIDPTGHYLYFAAGNQQPGIAIYRLPLDHPDSAHLEEFHRYSDVVVSPCDPGAGGGFLSCSATPAFGAGGIAFGTSGRLYVVLLAKNQLSILQPDGTEALRFPSPQDNAELDVPLSTPFDLAFDGHGTLLVSQAGDATFGNGPGNTPPPGGQQEAKNWVVYDVWVNDIAAPLSRPNI
jgi:streptogramin lyase